VLVSQFLLGLREDLRTSVEVRLPKTVSQVVTLLEIQDHLSGKIKHQPRKFATHKADNKPSFSNNEVWKASQLKEYRRVNNLCFKCGHKYTPTHTCSEATATLNVLDQPTFDGGGFLSDELLETLEAPQLHLIQDECYLSLHALLGQPQHKVIQLRTLVHNQALIILIDSSSFHTFLNSAIASKLQVQKTVILALSE
jgi:hypothetical protein